MCKTDKILNVLSQIEELGLSLKDVVDYHNNNNTPKTYDAFSGKNWASDDEEDDTIYLMDNADTVYPTNDVSNTSEVQGFIDEILNTDENLVSLLLSSWSGIKENNNPANIETEPEIPKKKSNRLNVYNKNDFKEYVNQKINECMNGWNCSNKNCKKFYHIHPEAHCKHTYNGTLCDNIIECDKVHIQRCFHEIDRFKNGKFVQGKECTNKNKKCKFIHRSDLKTDEAKRNFDNSIEAYKKKKYKQFFN